MCQNVVKLGLSRFCGQLQRIKPLNNRFQHIAFEMRGMDQIIGVVKLDLGFDVSKCSKIGFVSFLWSVAKD